MRRRHDKEVNIFNASAIDLFASSLGVFIILVVILFPYFRKQENVKVETIAEAKEAKAKSEAQEKTIEDLAKKVEELEKKKNDLEIQKNEKEIQAALIKKLQDELKTKLDPEVAKQELESLKLNQTEKDKQLKKSLKEMRLLEKLIQTERVARTQIENDFKESIKNQEKVELKLRQNEKELLSTKEKLKKFGKKGETEGSFVAVVAQWTTAKHDVDLKVTDPSNKVFNFKNRKFPGHPGLFSLDSRIGPGAELWQSSKIVPGNYKVAYELYNDYGNKEDTAIQLTVLTKKGRFSLPAKKLSPQGPRSLQLSFSATDDGTVIVR